MTRIRTTGTFLLALGASVAGLSRADTPPPPTLPDPAPAQPPERVIKIDIGFEPWPLDEPDQAPAAPPESTPASPLPAPGLMPPVAPTAPLPAGPAAPPPAAKAPPLTLAQLERMALGQFAQPAQAGGNRGPILQAYVYPGQAVPMTDNGGGTGGFVDQVVQASAAAPAQPQMLAQQYHLLNAVRLRYYHLLALQRLIAVREELASVTRDAVTAIDGMAAAGQATKAELLQARVEAREQMAALQNARAVYQSVWVRLAASVGQPELAFGSVAGDLEQAATLPAFEAAWTHVAAVSPEMQMVRAEVVRRQTTLRQTLGGANGKSCGCDRSGSDNVLAQAFARMSEPFTGVDPQVKQAAWADLSRCEAEIGRVEQSLRQRLADAYARCDRAREVCELYRTQNLPDAKEAYELSVLGYRQGRGSWPQVQIAQRNYFRMSTEYVEALAELRRSELVILGLLMDGPEEAMPQPAVKQAAYRR